jgi:hypothetical protein
LAIRNPTGRGHGRPAALAAALRRYAYAMADDGEEARRQRLGALDAICL